ncbi:MAG: lytic transglycosylase domain-containing protein, partial [Oscillospiraceae bacterium]
MKQRPKHRRGWLAPVLVILLAIGASVLAVRIAYPIRYREQVERTSAENGLDPALIFAVIRSESGFRTRAVSPIGARGLMQITEETFEWAKWRMGDKTTVYDDLFEPEVNIRYGGYILSLLLGEFVSTDTALAAY